MNTFCLAITIVLILAFALVYGALIVLERTGILYPSDAVDQHIEPENKETDT